MEARWKRTPAAVRARARIFPRFSSLSGSTTVTRFIPRGHTFTLALISQTRSVKTAGVKPTPSSRFERCRGKTACELPFYLVIAESSSVEVGVMSERDATTLIFFDFVNECFFFDEGRRTSIGKTRACTSIVTPQRRATRSLSLSLAEVSFIKKKLIIITSPFSVLCVQDTAARCRS